MSYTLRLKDIVIGWSDLESRDANRRIARGPFRPGLGYELVEPIFVLRPGNELGPDMLEREARYRRARDTLDLALYAPDGAEVDTARIDIMRDDRSPTELALEVAIVDREFWRA
ncbi:MAG: hypothetical protein ACT4P7_04210 [Gemmatimonadaceae bacterium]